VNNSFNSSFLNKGEAGKLAPIEVVMRWSGAEVAFERKAGCPLVNTPNVSLLNLQLLLKQF